ncbi:phosphopantetheine-binding protein [Exiguobacterium sp. 17-1]|uniref:phosphopantetheine-binding protein n=1 Tax=Exiguobacterium TaxID=33986 RepID=UPI001FFEA881|nr:phosphopantetheine-binding protein [Exiguobacterium sp. 17-1]MCK2157653.1 phosphopantetheine-binding protein [Exiguobacterium sp. 17-1]
MNPLLDYKSFCQIVEEQLDVNLRQELTGQELLRDDLQLDSIRLLQLLVHLELEHGYVLADEQLAQLPQMTVDQLLQSLARKEVV